MPESPTSMSMAPDLDLMPPLVLRLPPELRLSEKQFVKICQLNEPLRFETTSEGDLVIMAPEGSETGNMSFDLTGQFSQWVRTDGTGLGFGSSAGFTLPNGAWRNPDMAWVTRSRWEALTRPERARFAPFCPDFVMELRSPSDPLRHLQAKMQEYIDNGARLGWLIDPLEHTVYVYRPGAPVERLEAPETLSGDPVLPGFVLDLREIWNR